MQMYESELGARRGTSTSEDMLFDAVSEFESQPSSRGVSRAVSRNDSGIVRLSSP